MKKLTTGLIGLLLALVLCVSLLPVTAQAADAPSVDSWNIALKDNIIVTFNVNVPDVSNTTISATVNGAAVETSQSVSGNTCTVSVPLAAAQLNDSIKLIYDVNGSQSESREYTVKEYASYVLDGSYDVAVKQMVSQMLSYGAAAQNYFNYNTGAMANAGVDNIYADITMPTDVTPVSVTDNLEKVTYIGTSLVFRSQVYARFYFKMDDRDAEINNYTVTINGEDEDCTYGKFYDPQGRYNYFADSPGITPNNYDQQLNVVITNTDGTTMTINYSPLNYIVNKSSSSTANLPELMKAMYGYHVESYQYMNYENAAATTFGSATGYGTNGIQYDSSSNAELIFALAAENSTPAGQDYYPQSADCIKLVRNGETTSVADVTKATIQKRSSDAYHIYVQNLNTELQDQDVLIVEGKFSTDRADDYYDGETLNIAKAYVYVDLSYDNKAEITGTEPVLWQAIDVGPFYTHTESQNNYKYMAADENDMPDDSSWNTSYNATGNVSLTYVHDGTSEVLDTNGLLIKKWGTKDYFIEGGGYNTTTLQDGEYFILEGQFKNNDQKTVINVAKTYIFKDSYNGEIFIAGELPQGWQVVDVGPFKTHANTYQTYQYMAADENDMPTDTSWSTSFMATGNASLTHVHGGTSEVLDTNGLLIKKWGANDYYIENGPYSSTTLQNGEYFILEGYFEHTGLKVAINVAKTYIYKDTHSGEVTIAGTLPTDIPYIEWLKVGQNDAWLEGGTSTIDGLTHYDGGVYASFPTTNVTHGGGTWGCEYVSTSVDNVKIIRNGVTTSVSRAGANALDMYNENYMYIKFHTRYSVEYTDANGNPSPLQAGDILIVEGLFKHKTTGEKVWIEKSYITLFADGTTAFSAEMPVSHTVTLNANGGSCSTTSLTTTTGGKVTLPTPTRTHYTFGGWSDGTTTYAAGTKLTVTSDMTLTAQWTINQYTVTYNYNGVSSSPASATVNAGTAVTLPTPTRANYTFNGWSDGSNTYAGGASYTVNGNVTLTAQWTIIQYTVTYNYNGNGQSNSTATVNAGSAVTLPTPTRSGYRFTGWYTAASGGTKVGDANASYTPTGNVTVYAQWIAQYTVTYDSNGGNSTPDSVTVDSGTTINLAAAPSRSSYTFNGWSDGSTTYDAGASYTVTGNVTFTAQWQRCLVEGTLITMADGTLKAVEDIVVGDEVLTWSFINGTYEITPVCLAVDDGVGEYTILTLNFEDGTALRIIDEHGVFDADLNKYAYINPENVDEYIGHVFVKLNADGSVTTTKFTGYSLSTETVGCYTLQTAFNVNCVAEGLLTQTPPLCEGYFDYFEMGDFMQYDQEQMQADIEKYGLYTYEDFQDYLTYDAFIAFNGPYLKVAVGKGYFTFDYLVEKIKAFGIGIE